MNKALESLIFSWRKTIKIDKCYYK
jgi:hypothetical protein